MKTRKLVKALSLALLAAMTFAAARFLGEKVHGSGAGLSGVC